MSFVKPFPISPETKDRVETVEFLEGLSHQIKHVFIYTHDGELEPKPRVKTLQDIAAQQPWPRR